MRSRISSFFIVGLCIAVLGLNSLGQNNSKELKAGEEQVNKASQVITEIMGIAEKSIPTDLLRKSNAIVVFPGAIKAGFIFGGQGGKGAVIRRLKNGWSAPAFLTMGGGSFGLQAGGQATDYILVVMNEKGLKGLMDDKFELGGEGSVSAGPVGRTTAASTNLTMDAEILTYSRSKGAFAGVSLKGVVISHNNDMNRAIYQKTARQLLFESPVIWSDAPKQLQKFSKTVAKYAN